MTSSQISGIRLPPSDYDILLLILTHTLVPSATVVTWILLWKTISDRTRTSNPYPDHINEINLITNRTMLQR